MEDIWAEISVIIHEMSLIIFLFILVNDIL